MYHLTKTNDPRDRCIHISSSFQQIYREIFKEEVAFLILLLKLYILYT